MWRTSPDRAQPGLHAEPMDVTIGQLLAPYLPGGLAVVIDGSNTTSTHTKTFSFTVHHAYAKLVKKDMKGTPYSSHSNFEFVEIAIDSKTAETISNLLAIKR